MIAWLEKQGKQSSNILWHDVSEEPEARREIFCEWKSSTGAWHSVVFYHAYSKTFCEGERIIKNVLKWTYVNEMLEKQGEQKSVAKVEPKFKIGDFIVNDYCRGKVVELTNDAYLLDTGQGIPFSCEHNIHLLSIEDVKELKKL